jgi:hypothetical protein
MEDPHNSWVPESLIKCSKAVHGCYDQPQSGEKLEQFLSTSGVKQGDNLAPVLFIFVIHAGIQHSRQEMGFTTLTLDGFRTLKLEASREDNYAEPILQQGHNVLVLQVLLCRYGLHSSQPRK